MRGPAEVGFDANHANRPYHERNGYVFDHFNAPGFESALHRAIGRWYSYPPYFCELVTNGMRYDYSWNRPGGDYLNVYELIRDR